MKTIFGFRLADITTIIFICILLGITTVFYGAIPNAALLIAVYGTLLILQFVIFKTRGINSFLRLTYDLILPVVGVLIVFDSLGWVVHYVNPNDIDSSLIKLDYMLFNNHPTVMLEAMTSPLLTDALQVAYSSYYFLPIIFGVSLLKSNQKKEFDKTLFLILLCFYLSYLGYIIWPALGPRFTLKHLQNKELQGFFVAGQIQQALNNLEGIKRDAFPSGHTAVTLTVLYLAYRFKRRLFWIFLPIVAALIFSTVYCRYHYVVDVIAGFGLALVTILSGEIIMNRLSRSDNL